MAKKSYPGILTRTASACNVIYTNGDGRHRLHHRRFLFYADIADSDTFMITSAVWIGVLLENDKLAKVKVNMSWSGFVYLSTISIPEINLDEYTIN